MSRPNDASSAETRQREHFDRIMDEYIRHFDDPTSRQYRYRFAIAPLLADLDLEGLEVLEGMCGPGQATGYLLSRGANVCGIDISEEGIRAFGERWPDCRAICGSIFDTGLPDASFDVVLIVGGLHHVQPDVDRAIREVHRLLRPGGRLCFAEPHAGSLPDLARTLWYRLDRRHFEANERPVDLRQLQATWGDRFVFERERYGGNIAYMLVYHSLILRIPLGLKRWYAAPIVGLEGLIQRVQGPRLSIFVTARWRKRD